MRRNQELMSRAPGKMLIAGIVSLAVIAVSLTFTPSPARAYPTPADVTIPPDPNPKKAAQTADSELVTSNASEQADITVYGQAYAQVQETRTVRLKAGRNRIQLNGVAAKYRTDSLRVIDAKGAGTFTYRSATYQPANLTNDRLLADSVGKQVKAWRWTTKGVQEVVGTLQNVSGSALVIDVGDGKTELVNSGEVTLLETPTGLSNTPSLVIEADATAGGDYQIDFLYETDGITWSAKHSLIVDEAKSTVASWEATVSLVNDSGTSFKNATLRLLSGRVTQGEGGPSGQMYLQGARSADFAAPEAASVENVGDQKLYVIPGKVNLAAGQTRQIPLFNGKDVPVKRTYVAGTVTGRSYSADGKYDAQIRLTVENCEKHHLGQPIPGGLVKVYQYSANNKLQVTGSTRIGDKAQDETFDLNIGTSSDIKWDVKVVEAKTVAGTADDTTDAQPKSGPRRAVGAQPVQPQGEEVVYEDRVYEVTVYNHKRDRDVEVKIEVGVPVKQQLEPKWLRPRADRAETTLTVKKTDKSSVRYTVRQRAAR